MIIRMNDLRLCGICIDGARSFWDTHNLDWVDFLINGIDSDILLRLNDHMATEAVEKTEGRLLADGR